MQILLQNLCKMFEKIGKTITYFCSPGFKLSKKLFILKIGQSLVALKGVFAKNERGYRRKMFDGDRY